MRALGDRLTGLGFRDIVTWLESPDGEQWSSQHHDPVLGDWLSLVEEKIQIMNPMPRWPEAWHCSQRPVVKIFTEDGYCELSTKSCYTPDLGPEYISYPQVRSAT